MKIIELEKTKLTFLNEHIVTTETKEGVVIDYDTVKEAYDIIEEELSGSYTLIIDRRNKYRLMRFEVAKEDERRDRLEGIAIVTYNNTALKMAQMDKHSSQKPFAIFEQLDDAISWAKDLHFNLQGI